MPDSLTEAQVNFFADTYKPVPNSTIRLAEALDSIRTGVYAAQLAYVRRMLARGESSYRAAKNKLPAFTFAGTFAPSRLIAHLQQHTGIVHADLDHLSDVAATKRKICADPRTVYLFISPRGGEGLKFGVKVPVIADDPAYKYAWQAVATEFERRHGGHWDPSGKDISRLCYVSYDPDLYMNLDADMFEVPPAPIPEPKPSPEQISCHPHTHAAPRDYAERAVETATLMIQAAPMGTRHYTRLRAARLLGGYVAGGLLSGDQAYGALAQALVGHTDDLERALKTVGDGLRYGQAHPITLEALEAERQAWLATRRNVPQEGLSRPFLGARYVREGVPHG